MKDDREKMSPPIDDNWFEKNKIMFLKPHSYFITRLRKRVSNEKEGPSSEMLGYDDIFVNELFNYYASIVKQKKGKRDGEYKPQVWSLS